jgi:hypothetical protein
MKTAKLARAIERELLVDRPRSAPTPECFACGRGYVPKPSGDASTSFCSVRCREAFDAGFPPYDPTYHHKTNQRWYSLPLGRHGFLIDCAGCGKRFDSKGLRCCSIECERALRPRSGSKRRCERCQGDIPRWRNGRKVSKATRFCSPKCARSARRPSGSSKDDSVAETIKKCPENGPQNRASAATPIPVKGQWALVERSLRDPRNAGLRREWSDRPALAEEMTAADLARFRRVSKPIPTIQVEPCAPTVVTAVAAVPDSDPWEIPDFLRRS